MNTDDDQLWLDALAGRKAAASAPSREAHALRLALRALDPARSGNELPHNVALLRNPAREDALIERAVREGVIDTSRAQTQRRRTSWQLPLAASVLIVVAAGIFVRLQPSPTADVVRGDENGVVRLQAADAAALKQTLLAELRAAGVNATGYEALGVHGIDADLPLPLTSDVKRVLAAYGVAEPPDGALRIEIRSPE